LVLYFFTKANWQKIGIQTTLFGALAVIYFFIRSGIVDPNPSSFETLDNSLFAIDGRLDQLSTAFGMIGEYFKLLIVPHPLSFDYSYNTFPEMGWLHWKVLLSLAAIGGLLYWAIKGLKDKDPISFSILFFAITFVVTSNIFFLIGVTFAERLMFTPLLGFCILTSVLLQKYLVKDAKEIPYAFYGILGGILLLFSIKTFTRNFDWKNFDTLFATGIQTAPNSARTQSFYGVINRQWALAASDVNLRNEYLSTSAKYLEKSIETYPSFTETYHHLAQTYEAQNKAPAAAETYKKAIKNDPTYYNSMTNLGILYYNLKDYATAENYLNQSLALAPNVLVTIRTIGLTYEAMGKYDQAIPPYETALEMNHSEEQLMDLGRLNEKMGNHEKAMYYEKEIRKLRGITN